MKPSISILIFAFIWFLGCSQSGPQGKTSSQVALAGFHPSEFENYTTQLLQEKWIVGASSKRGKGEESNTKEGGEPNSELFALFRDNNQWKEVFRRQFPGAYNARLSTNTRLRYGGNPIAIFQAQEGAAVESIEVYGLKDDQLILLQSLEAGAFVWAFDDSKSESILVGIPHGKGDEILYYSWNGRQFEKRSKPGRRKAY
jgi:hypothetical protein